MAGEWVALSVATWVDTLAALKVGHSVLSMVPLSVLKKVDRKVLQLVAVKVAWMGYS